MTTSAEAMEAYRGGLLGTGLVRVLAAATDWVSPADGGGRPLITGMGNNQWLNLFSDDVHLMGFCANNDLKADLFVQVSGESVFGSLPDTLAGVNLDPDTPDGFHYRQAQFGMLRSVVDAMAIERFLHGATDVKEPFARMLHYGRYVVLEKEGGASCWHRMGRGGV